MPWITQTYVVLQIAKASYDDIRQRLIAAGQPAADQYVDDVNGLLRFGTVALKVEE
jgi:hypothetical protein